MMGIGGRLGGNREVVPWALGVLRARKVFPASPRPEWMYFVVVRWGSVTAQWEGIPDVEEVGCCRL